MRFRVITLALLMLFAAAALFAQPTAKVKLLGPPKRALIGTDVTFCVRFENDGTQIGMGPFIDVMLDNAGGTTTSPCDGLSYTGATLVHTNPSMPLSAVATPQTAAPCGPVTPVFTHPWDPPATPPASVAGWQFVRIELPFGSFQPGQAPLDVEITAKVHPQADVGVPLPVRVRGGYRWNGPFFSAWDTQNVTPEVVMIEKTFLGADNESVSGPNFPGQYQIKIDVAPGQTIANATLNDCATIGLIFTSNNCFTQSWASLSGQVVLTPQFTLVEPPSTVATLSCSRTIQNRAELIAGTWTPVNDPPINFATFTPRPSATVSIQERALAIQKKATGTPAPGGTLTYKLDFQVSDLHRFRDIVVTDVLSDGHSTPSAVTLAVSDRFGSLNVTLPVPSTCVKVTPNFAQKYVCPPGKATPCAPASPSATVAMTGGTRLEIDVSCAMKASTQPFPFRSGVLTGGLALPPAAGPATGSVTFSVQVNDQFSTPQGTGDPFIDKHDPLRNAASILGMRASNAALKNPPAVGPLCGDQSYTCLSVPPDSLSKSVYAKNGVVLNPIPPPTGSLLPQFTVGDTLTYRISKTIPTGDGEKIRITDWFVWPILKVPATLPAVLTPCGPLPPTLATVACYVAPSAPTVSAVQPNGILFDFGTVNNPANTPQLYEVYVTLKVSNDPRPDGMHLTNHVQECEVNTFGEEFCQTALAQFQLQEPALRIKKAIICPPGQCPSPFSDMTRVGVVPPPIDPSVPSKAKWNCPSPSSCPRFTGIIAGTGSSLLNLTSVNADANDELSMAVVVENYGSGPNGAFGVKIGDQLGGLPGNIVAGSICVRRGDGTPIPHQLTSGGFPITLTTALPPPGSAGKNVVVVTFRVKMPSVQKAEIGKCLTNTATVDFYTNEPNGSNFVGGGFGGAETSTVSACVAPELLDKTIAATSELHTVETPSPRPVTIGEIVRYRLMVDIPEGMTTNPLILTDTLPAGFRYLGPSVISVVPAGIIPPPQQPAQSGQTLTFSLGPVNNTNNTPECELVVIEFPVLVLNDAQNAAPQLRANGFTVTAPTGVSWTFAPTNDSTVTLVEPHIKLTKTVAPANVPQNGSPTFTIALQSDGTADAFEVQLTDVFPAGLINLSAAAPVVMPVNCATFSPPTFTGSTMTSSAPKMPPGCTATFTINCQLAPGWCGQGTNVAKLTYTSLPGPKGTLVNATLASVPGNSGALDGERVYTDQSSASFSCVPHMTPCDFSITKSGTVQQTPAGLLVTYTITANVNPQSIDCPFCVPIRILDSLPQELTNITVGPLPQFWTHTLTGTQLQFSTTKQPPPMPATFTVSGIVQTVPPSKQIRNCVRILCNDANPANNSQCVTLNLP